MYLILMRHGEAVPQTENIANKNRPLTPAGVREARKTSRILAGFLKGREIEIIASPFLRTRQTAEILSEECKSGDLHTAEELLQGDFRLMAAHLLKEGKPIALVSHHPFLQNYLLASASAAIKFTTGSIAVVKYDLSWKEGTLLAYFTAGVRNIRKEEP